ncbi:MULTISPECIES: aspartate-semialdehyde dehydrogenase [unclassified Streptomyces]|uniref:aspartate-semialdehyde dehydrogenase n=1 Tax=unclassified Streptomyces TaxID=2593676 RepID=UPI001BE9E06D|nr:MULTISPECIES: aspartate-semialdehyde dehydrogenase [unclassified Streptomyces]MBT2403257.1 aspartate-semialdehyde dehydrogenase [Streptomyces sp. ISL-21]MBT2457425.1 aspartate-semialdehyde dehydrogenase [Streptomyces sp. ISL-86]MBT2609787.1 aspartate-semialdehyde dehydrogenase [Streptomyces sp. ISL-87]
MLRIAIIGATGAVGRECLALLDSGIVPVEQVVPVGSARSVGRDLGAELALSLPMAPLVTIGDLDPQGLDVAIFCAGVDVSNREAERLASAGVLIVDNSSAFRMRPDVPLVVPQVNPGALADRPVSHLVANPNCSTIQLVRALHPLHELAALESVVVATYQAASGGGLRGLEELAEGSRRLLEDRSAPSGPGGRFGQPLPFNLVPEIGLQDDSGLTHEERKLVREPRKILGLPELRVSATAVRVPVFDCHSEAVHVRLREPVTTAAVEEALAATPGLRVYSRSDSPSYPMPRSVFARPQDRALVHVGRIRVEPEDPRAVAVWVVADNLWVGAALNAVQIVELATKNGWLG